MLSRMKNFWNKSFNNQEGHLKQGHEFTTLYNMFGYNEIGLVTRWRDGRLHDDGEIPAVEFQDAHVEHYLDGVLHMGANDEDGKLKPAIITEYGTKFEYYLKGKQIQQPQPKVS